MRESSRKDMKIWLCILIPDNLTSAARETPQTLIFVHARMEVNNVAKWLWTLLPVQLRSGWERNIIQAFSRLLDKACKTAGPQKHQHLVKCMGVRHLYESLEKEEGFSEYTVALLCFRESHINCLRDKRFSLRQCTAIVKTNHPRNEGRSCRSDISAYRLHSHTSHRQYYCAILYPRLIISLIPDSSCWKYSILILNFNKFQSK